MRLVATRIIGRMPLDLPVVLFLVGIFLTSVRVSAPSPAAS
jgi:hypothetical protein